MAEIKKFALRSAYDSGAVDFKEKRYYIRKGFVLFDTEEERAAFLVFIEGSGNFYKDAASDQLSELELLNPLEAAQTEVVNIQKENDELKAKIEELKTTAAKSTVVAAQAK
jgi:hypothetical protein